MTDFNSQILGVFREVFDNESLVLYDEMQAKDVHGWDSLTHISLIMAIEDEFKIKFSTREVMGFQNVGEMLTCLQSKVNQ